MKCEEVEILCECDQAAGLPESAQEHLRICPSCAAYAEKARREDRAFREAFSVFFDEESWQRVKARLHDRLDQQSLRKTLSQKANVVARWWPMAAAASAVLTAFIAFDRLIPPSSNFARIKIVPLDVSDEPTTDDEAIEATSEAKDGADFLATLRRENVFGELAQLKTYCAATEKTKALTALENIELYLERMASPAPATSVSGDLRAETFARFSACLADLREELRDNLQLPAASNAAAGVLAALEKVSVRAATEAGEEELLSPRADASELFAAADKLFADGEYQAAADAYLLLAARYPETDRAACARYSAAFIQQKKLGRMDLAATHYRALASETTGSFWTQNAAFRLAEIGETLNSPKVAAFAYKDFLARAPRHPRTAEAREKISYLNAVASEREAVPPGWAYEFVAGRHAVSAEQTDDGLDVPEKVSSRECAKDVATDFGGDPLLDVPLAADSKNDPANADEPRTFLLSPEKEGSAKKTSLSPGFNLKRTAKNSVGAHATGNLVGPQTSSPGTTTKDADSANCHDGKSATDQGADNAAKGEGQGAATDKSGGNAGGGKGPAAGGGSSGGGKGPAAGGGSSGGGKSPAAGGGSSGGGKGPAAGGGSSGGGKGPAASGGKGRGR